MKKVLFILLFFFSLDSQAQNAIHYTTDNGLHTNNLYGAMMDDDGFVWVYSSTGIAKFDGYTFKHFGVKDGLATNDVWGLMQDADGRIWCIAYSEKVNYILNDSVYTVHKSNSNLFKKFPYWKEQALANVVKKDNRTFVQISSVDWLELKGNSLTPSEFMYSETEIFKDDHLYISPNPNLLIKQRALKKEFIIYANNPSRGLMPIKEIKGLGDFNLRHFKASPIRDKGVVNGISENFNSFILLKNTIFKKFSTQELGWVKQNTRPYIQLIQNQLMLSNSFGDILHIDSNLNIKDQYRNHWFGINTDCRAFIDRKKNVWIASLGKGLYLIPATKRDVQFIPIGDAKIREEGNIIKRINKNFYIATSLGKLYELESNYSLHKISKPAFEVTQSRGLFGFDKGIMHFQVIPYYYNSKNYITYDFFKNQKTDKSWKPMKYLNGGTKSAIKKNKTSFFASSTYGLYQYDLSKNKEQKIAAGRYYALAYIQDKGLWFGGPNGLKYWDENNDKVSDTLSQTVCAYPKGVLIYL